MLNKYILNSTKINKKQSKILIITSSISIILLLLFTLMFFSLHSGIENRNNKKFGEYDLKIGYIDNNYYYDNYKLKNIPILYEKMDKLLILPQDDSSVIYGVENDSMELEKYQALQGTKKLEKNKIIVNKNYAEKYNLNIGDNINLHNKEYEISGVLGSNIEDSLSLKIFIDLTTLQTSTNLFEKINLIQIKSKENKENIKQMLNEYFNDEKLKYDTMKNKEIEFKKLQIYTPLFYIILVGMIVTYIISLYGIFSIRIKSRYSELITLKRLGIRNIHIYRIFIGENVSLALVGSIIGIIFSGIIYTIFSFIFQYLEIPFEPILFFKIILFGIGYIIFNLFLTLITTYVLLYKLRNTYADEIEVTLKKGRLVNTKVGFKVVSLFIINLIVIVISKKLNIESMKYIAVIISIISFMIVVKYFFIILYKLTENEKLFYIKYPIKSFAKNYNKYALNLKLMILAVAVIVLVFNYLNIFSEKVRENTLSQLPADYIITNSDQDKSENFIDKLYYEEIKNKVDSSNLVKIEYTKNYTLASKINYSNDWIRLSEKSEVDVNQVEIIKLDVNKKNMLRNFNVISGKSLSEKFLSNELIINKKLQILLNLKLDDILELRDSTGKIEKYKISTIIDNNLYPFNLVLIAPSNSKIETTNILALEIYNLSDNSYFQIKELVNANANLEGVYAKDIITENIQFYNFIFYALFFLNIFILIIFMISLFNSLLISLEERRTEIQTLKNIGVSFKKIQMYMLGELYIVFITVIVLSLLLYTHILLILSVNIEIKSFILVYGLLICMYILLIKLSKKFLKNYFTQKRG